MRVLFISKSIHDVSGAGVGSRMHLNVLKKLVGEENVYVVDVGVSETACREEKYIAYGKYHGILDRLNRCLEGNTYLFSNKIIGDICQLIKNESISFVFVDAKLYQFSASFVRNSVNDFILLRPSRITCSDGSRTSLISKLLNNVS